MNRFLLGVLASMLMIPSAAFAGEQPWTVRDSVELTYYVSDDGSGAQGSYYTDNAKVTPSPDGTKFFVLTMRGDIDQDLSIYQLVVHDAAAIAAAIKAGRPAPAPVATHQARTRDFSELGRIGIRQATWTADSSAIYFLETDQESNSALRRLEIATGAVKTLSPPGMAYVETFKLDGDRLVFRERVSHETMWQESDLPYPVNYVDSDYFKRALSWQIPRYQSYLSVRNGAARKFGHVESQHTARTLGDISPDGRWIVAAKSSEGQAAWKGHDIKNDRDASTQFYLFDTTTLEGRKLIEAPVGWAVSDSTRVAALWFPDSRRVLLVNTMLPLDAADPNRKDSAYIVEYDVVTQATRVVAALPGAEGKPYPPGAEVEWKEPGRELSVTYKRGTEHFHWVYRLRGAQWVGRRIESRAPEKNATAPIRLAAGVKVEIRQSVNEPPRLVAALNGKEMQLSAEDPVIARARLLPVEKMEWTDARGKPWSGALVLPEASMGRSALPLIVQLGDVNFDRFSPDGVTLRPGHSAQTFAARGYVVLTLSDSRESDIKDSTVDELPNFRGGVDAAVRKLEERGLIDAKKVGLLGHSRMGFRTFYIATQAKGFVPAAVAVQDSFSGGFNEYVLARSLFPNMEGIEELYSREKGKPFWHNKQAWLETSTSFTLDKMQSPLLLLYLSENLKGPPVIGMTAFMEAYAGLRILKKPIEAASFPGGTHNPINAAHRAANQELVLDWMEFWVLGRENSNPAFSERNRRWREMRETWEASRTTAGYNQVDREPALEG